MKSIDAHVHLSDVEYAKCTDELVTDAKDSGVVALVSNSGFGNKRRKLKTG